MRLLPRFVIALTVASAASIVMSAQTAPQTTPPQETSTAVKGGGILVPGWMGRTEATREDAGLTVNDAKFTKEGNVFKVHTGPAVTYWNPANKATGNYTVKATFDEPEYMGINTHPHPYGIVIAGNEMGTDQQSYVYCSAYGNGTFIFRGFGPTAFSMTPGRGGMANDAVHKAGAGTPDAGTAQAKGKPVKQDIAMSVTADAVTCTINGTVVATYPKTDIVAAGKLKSTDGVYGIRFAHNTEGSVTGFAMTKDK